MAEAESAGATEDRPTRSGSAGRASLGVLQRLGRSLMLPIAALPVAALLLRLGQPDMLGAGDSGLALATYWPWLEPVAAVLAAAGGVLFTNLGLLFAVGVAVGFARRSDGSTALAAVVGYLVFGGVADAMSPYVLAADDVAAGDRRLRGVRRDPGRRHLRAAVAALPPIRLPLPRVLRRTQVRPILTANAGLALAVLLSFAYPAFDRGLEAFGGWLVQHDIVGAGAYGVANRLLIPFGLHHLLNSVPWFVVGATRRRAGRSCTGTSPGSSAGTRPPAAS